MSRQRGVTSDALGRPTKCMKLSSTIRGSLAGTSLLLGFCACSSLSAQVPQSVPAKPSGTISTLPAAQPTGATAGQAVPASAPAAPHHVEVDYSDGKLAVNATNASLNEILREVSHKTGIKITGGVEDDRVFGQYGPSKPSIVLEALLDGTGTNILLVDDAKGGSELILTPRHGGATPPNPNAAQSNEPDESIAAPRYVPPVRPYQPPFATGRGPGLLNASPEGFPAAAPSNGDSSDANSPKTPQQIYDQLQRTSQQQKQSANGPQQ